MPADFPSHSQLQHLSLDELQACCQQLRQEILTVTSQQGGHLASSLGTVELTVALHKYFDFFGKDKLFWDVGHQSYAHKLLTGRAESFQKLRHIDGCSGFTNPTESPADPVFSGHAGVAVSQALGAAQAKALKNEDGRCIAVIGDGSLSCGIIWEALNNTPRSCKRLLIILNDNQMSISPNLGSFRKCLNNILSGRFYNRIRRAISSEDKPTSSFTRILRRMAHSIKGMLLSNGILFQELGLRYFGPFDGNDLGELLKIIPKLPTNRPVLLHLVTVKGKGYSPAERLPDNFHGVPPFDLETGIFNNSTSHKISFSCAFAQAVTALAQQQPALAVVCPAMLQGTGFEKFQQQFPQRCFDTGIAEADAVAFASGLATQGIRPVVAIYSTFLQRALDNVFHDVCLNNLPVIFGIDRCGATSDGPTHHGFYSLSFLLQMPNMTIMTPWNQEELNQMVRFAWSLASPVAIRLPRKDCPDPIEGLLPAPPLESKQAWVMRNPAQATLTIWAHGAEVTRAFELALALEQGNPACRVRIVNPRFILPFDANTALELSDTPQVILDDYTESGLTSCLRDVLAKEGRTAPVLPFTWPERTILPQGTVSELVAHCGLSIQAIAQTILNLNP